MKYNGIELVEMVPENWNGKSREMLVWNSGDKEPKIKRVIGFDAGFAIGFKKGEDPYYLAHNHCAEIPVETYISNNLTEEEIIEKFKTLRTELKRWLKNNDSRNLLVNNLQYGIKTALNLTNVNHHYIDVVDFSKIETNEKKTKRMTYKELDEWLKEGKGVCKLFSYLTNKITYPPSMKDDEVKEGILICTFGTSNFEEPLIEESRFFS